MEMTVPDFYFLWPGSPFAVILVVILALFGVAGWAILAVSRFVQGGAMERPERVAQLYGYTVCLVSVIVALVSAIRVVGSTLDLGAPQLAATSNWGWDEPSVSSFEAYRATYERARRFGPGGEQLKPDTTPEPELRRRYEALRADRIERVTFQSRRSIITGMLSFALAAALFVWHWRWVRRRLLPNTAASGMVS